MFYSKISQAILIAITFCTSSLNAQGVGEWLTNQLNQSYMESITKSTCVEKSRVSLKGSCGMNEECVKTLGGVTGDCIAMAQGELALFCESFDRWRKTACLRNEMDGRSCLFFEITQSSSCKSTVRR